MDGNEVKMGGRGVGEGAEAGNEVKRRKWR